MTRFLLLSTMDNTKEVRNAVKGVKRSYGNIISLKKIYFHDYEKGRISRREVEKEVEKSDIILVDIRGQSKLAGILEESVKKSSATVVVLVGGNPDIFRLIRMGSFKGEDIAERMDYESDVEDFRKSQMFSEFIEKLGKVLPVGKLKHMRNWVTATEYYSSYGAGNLKNLLLFLYREYGDGEEEVDVSPPEEMPNYGLWWPNKGFFKDLQEFRKEVGWGEDRPTIGVFFYGGMHFRDCVPAVEEIIKKAGPRANLVPVFSEVVNNLKAFKTYFFEDGEPFVDLVINIQYFRLHGGPYGGSPEPTYELLKEMDVPVMIGYHSYSTEIEEWRKSEKANALEMVLGVILPELDGCVEPIYISGLKSLGEDEYLEGEVKVEKALPERVEKLIERALNWIDLKKKEPEEKKIAIILYNYPPGEENLGSAGYLDGLKSLRLFLQKLSKEGYEVDIPSEDMSEFLLSRGVVNSPKWGQTSEISVEADKYINWFSELPEEARKDVENNWGSPPGDIMLQGDELLVPGTLLGNVFVGLQPSRGVHEDSEKAYHDKDLPPHHQYICFYKWLEEEFEADAILHWGMHGTLEFTKGKEFPLSEKCFPDILMGDTPNLYYYWVGNPAEGTIAKRRGYSVNISHSSPPVTSAGLYGGYLEIGDLLDEFRKAERREEKEELGKKIEEKASSLELDYHDFSDLESNLYQMKQRLIPRGLHILDEKLQGEDLVNYLNSVLRFDREIPSLHRILAERKGREYERLEEEPELAEEIDEEARGAISKVLEGEKVDVPPEIADYILDLRERAVKSDESGGLLQGLRGGYLLPRVAGDPIRSPEVYPCGGNMYEFDPRRIPHSTARRRGEEAAEEVLQRYLWSHDGYPESVGSVLWGFETVKTKGETIAQILSYLGVRLVEKGPWFKELEAIPLEELGRPRIDVFVTICGIFRDLFQSQIGLLNRAVEKVAHLDEPTDRNFVRKHYLEMKGEFGDFARARIFGPSGTEYATPMRTMVENSAWGDESELVESYDRSMNYAYLDENLQRIEKSPELFKRLTSGIDAVTQVRDNAEYEFTDLDHYYEFFGGLSRSVEEKKGSRPEQLVVDSADAGIEVEDVGKVIERASRTRTLNPKWIDGMLKHDFHGAQKIADRVEYTLGLAATTGAVDSWIWSEIAERYVYDEEMLERIAKNNRFATMKLMKRLLEAHERGYWEATEEEIRELKEAYMQIEGLAEEIGRGGSID